jgi:hypothetical protein
LAPTPMPTLPPTTMTLLGRRMTWRRRRMRRR